MGETTGGAGAVELDALESWRERAWSLSAALAERESSERERMQAFLIVIIYN